uniref:Uncharacterized protein n=1 Tax=Arundo donax TaxID=35708 RepID=A0A0A9BVF9_ARUDO
MENTSISKMISMLVFQGMFATYMSMQAIFLRCS